MNVERYIRLIAGAFVMLSLALGLLRESVLVFVHRFRRAQSISIGVYQLVPYDDVSS